MLFFNEENRQNRLAGQGIPPGVCSLLPYLAVFLREPPFSSEILHHPLNQVRHFNAAGEGEYSAAEIGGVPHTSIGNTVRAIVGAIDGVASSGLLYVWLVKTQGKESQLNRHIISIALTEDGGRAPWLEKLGDRLLSLTGSKTDHIEKCRSLAISNKQKIREILHRDLQYSGVIEENMTYSSKLLAIFGIHPYEAS